MTIIESSRHIEADARRVWDTISDVARWPEWLDTVDSVERLDDGPFRVGSRARVKQPGFPAAVWEVTELVDGHHFTWEAAGPGFRSIGRHVVVPAGDGADVTLGIEQTGPLAGLVTRLWGRRTRDYVEREGRCLADRVAASA
ncbi:MAG TPA: SRPBCC family protein [Marmoricola sp.]|nr:SRPBCC family protein [Marmoricola sp.]